MRGRFSRIWKFSLYGAEMAGGSEQGSSGSEIGRWCKEQVPAALNHTDAEYLLHGNDVTSALLFGPADEGAQLPRAYFNVEHQRVIGTGNGGDARDSRRRVAVAESPTTLRVLQDRAGSDQRGNGVPVHARLAAIRPGRILQRHSPRTAPPPHAKPRS